MKILRASSFLATVSMTFAINHLTALIYSAQLYQNRRATHQVLQLRTFTLTRVQTEGCHWINEFGWEKTGWFSARAILLSPVQTTLAFFRSQRESFTEAHSSPGILKSAKSIVGYQSELLFSLVSSLRLLTYHPCWLLAGGGKRESDCA